MRALLIGVAIPQLAAAALIAVGARPGLAGGYLAGLLLIAWIAVELLILRDYDVLIVATGAQLLPEETDGLTGPGWQRDVFTFYTPEGAEALRQALDRFAGGHLVVGIVDMPIKCPVAPPDSYCMDAATMLLRHVGGYPVGWSCGRSGRDSIVVDTNPRNPGVSCPQSVPPPGGSPQPSRPPRRNRPRRPGGSLSAREPRCQGCGDP